jgi:hypothetical protein
MKKTAYPELPLVDPKKITSVNAEQAVHILLKLTDECTARAVFAIIWAEARRKGENFTSAGHYNYSGVQTDGSRWGYSAPIVGRFWKIDSGGNNREFAAFANNEGFFDFMINRIKAKKFNGCNAEQWTNTYIQNWWSPQAKKQYVPGTEKFNQKKSIFNTANRKFDAYKLTYKPQEPKKKIVGTLLVLAAAATIIYILNKK